MGIEKIKNTLTEFGKVLWQSIADGMNYFAGGSVGGFAGFFISNDFTSTSYMLILVLVAIGLALTVNLIQKIVESNYETNREKLIYIENKLEGINRNLDNIDK